ncbi:hypothetical protein O971_25325, partial [Mycobacterium avium subsp. hominissuis 10-4249]
MNDRRSFASTPVARLACVALCAAALAGCQQPHKPAPTSSSTTPTTTASPTAPAAPPPTVRIAPLPVRPVTKSQPTTP